MKTILLVLLLATCAFAAVVLPNNLLLRVNFDTNPIQDVSPYQRRFVTKGNPTTAAGKFGNAGSFNAGARNAQNLDAYFTGHWQVGTIFTATAWFQLSVDGGAGHYPKILSNKNKFDDVGGWELQFNNGVFSLVTGTDGATSAKKDYALNTWYHIAMVVNEANVKFYLNGEDITADGNAQVLIGFGVPKNNEGAPISPGKDVTLGASANNDKVNDGGDWRGLLDEVRVYDKALTAAEVVQVFQEDDTKVTLPDPTGQDVPAISSSCLAADAPQATSSLKLTSNQLFVDAQGVQFPGRSNEYLSFSYVASWQDSKGGNADGVGQYRTQAKLTIANVGTGNINIGSIAIETQPGGTVYFRITSGGGDGVLAAGAQREVMVEYFNHAGLFAKTVVRNFLVIKTDDAVRPEIRVTLAGVFMTLKEGGDEIPSESIIPALGFSVNVGIGYNNFGIESLDHNIIGDGFSSFLYRAVDTTKPVYMQMAASFAPCCNKGGPGVTFYTVGGECNVKVAQDWAQSMYPLGENSANVAAKACTAPQGSFNFIQDGQWRSNTPFSRGNFIAMRFYPLRNEDGELVPNSYIVAQDYLHPSGCGTELGQANCDYNDNTYVIHNIAPADSNSIDRSAVTDLPIQLNFDHTITSGLLDSNGNNVGFTQYTTSTALDTSVRINSYKPSNLVLDAANKVLVVRATAGNFKTNDVTNGLRYALNVNKKSFGVSTKVKNANALPASVSAGVFLGSDQDNHVSLTVTGGVVRAVAELYEFSQMQTNQYDGIAIEPKVEVKQWSLGNATLPQGYSDVELFIFASPSTNSVSFGYNIGLGVVLFGDKFNLPGRNPTTGLSSKGRVLGWGVGAGILAYGGDSDVSFSNFAVQTCVATQVVSAPTGLALPTETTSSTEEGSESNATNAPGQTSNDENNNANTANTQQNQNTQTGLSVDVGTDRTATGSAGFIVPSLALLSIALFAL